MIVHFNEPTIINQHGCIQECMFVECVSVTFASDKSLIKFDIKNDKDFSIVDSSCIDRIE